MKQNDKKNPKLSKYFKVIVIVFLVLYLAILISNFYLHLNPELLDFTPLDPDVYGSFSDWAMVVVTAVTAYFIWKTLNSQMALQKDQSEIVKIETSRRIAEITPDFNFFRFGNEIILRDVFPNALTLELSGTKPAINIEVNLLIWLNNNSFDNLFQETQTYPLYHPGQGMLTFRIDDASALLGKFSDNLCLTITINCFDNMGAQQYNIVIAAKYIKQKDSFIIFNKKGPFPIKK